jgi:hypothetical protein
MGSFIPEISQRQMAGKLTFLQWMLWCSIYLVCGITEYVNLVNYFIHIYENRIVKPVEACFRKGIGR